MWRSAAAGVGARGAPGPEREPRWRRRLRRARSFDRSEPDARIEERIEQVRGQGRRGEDDADGQDPCLQHGEVAPARRSIDEATDALVVEEMLDDDQPADQIA